MLPLLTTLAAPQAAATASPNPDVPEAESGWLPELSFDVFWNESADEEETASDADTPVEEGDASAAEDLADTEVDPPTEPHAHLSTNPKEPAIDGRVPPVDATFKTEENSPILGDQKTPSVPSAEAKVSPETHGQQAIDDTTNKPAFSSLEISDPATPLAADEPVFPPRDAEPLISSPGAPILDGDAHSPTKKPASERLDSDSQLARQISTRPSGSSAPEVPEAVSDQRVVNGPNDTAPPEPAPAFSSARAPAPEPNVTATNRPIDTAPVGLPAASLNSVARIDAHRAPLRANPIPVEVKPNSPIERTQRHPINPSQVSPQPTKATAVDRLAGVSPAEVPKADPDRNPRSPDRIAPVTAPPPPPVATSVTPPPSSGIAPVFASLSQDNVSDRPGPDPLLTSELRFTSDAPSQLRSIPDAPQMRPELPRHMAAQLAEAIQRGGSNRPVDLTLSPAELGRVKISLSTADGSVTVHVSAERPETLDLMRRHADLLAQEFHMIGYGAAQFSFSQQRSDPRQNNLQDALTPIDDETTAIATAAPATTQALSITDRIDIRV